MPPNASIFPMHFRSARFTTQSRALKQVVLFNEADNLSGHNLSAKAVEYLASIGIMDMNANLHDSELVWMHALAICYSSTYLAENADGIKQDWPRIPLPTNRDLLLTSAELGRKVAMFLDTESPVPGITSGKIRIELKAIAVISRIDGGKLNPDVRDLDVTAGWGHAGKEGVTMPGNLKIVERDNTSDERAAINEGAEVLGHTVEEAIEHLGDTTCDIYLKNTAYWKNVPKKVWEYTIGGYQVIKKWLSYLEYELLSRALTVEEAREVMDIARRIVAILLLESALDENYLAVKLSTYHWPTNDD